MNMGKESENVEFKKTTGEMKEAMVSIASILNKHGIGTLYFGVKPNGDIMGQDVSESSLRDVSRSVYESIKPQIYPAITEEVLEDRHLIKVEFSGDEQPYSANGKYYIRTADEDREITPIELKNIFIANAYKEKWEHTLTDYSIRKVDAKAIKSFCVNAIAAGRLPDGKYTTAAILKRFNLAEEERLNNAGAYMFGNMHPIPLKMGIFATDEKLTILDMVDCEDNIFNLLQIAENYILKNIRWRAEIGLDREDIPEIPVAVIRELIANSFAHAQYNTLTNHEICIHPGFISFYSPGEYASDYTPSEYVKKNVPSSLRNATISKLLYLNKSIEKFGSGFKRIDSLCKDAGLKYSFDFLKNGFLFKVYRKNLPGPENVTVDVTRNVTLNKSEQLVLDILQIHPEYTRADLAASISKTTRTVQRILNSLRDKKVIERVGSDKTGYWKIL